MPAAPTRHAIRNRLLISMAASVLVGLTMTVVSLGVGSFAIGDLSGRAAEVAAMDTSVNELEAALRAQEAFVFEYAISGRPKAADGFNAAVTSELEASAALRQLVRDDPELLAAVIEATDKITIWRESWAEPFIQTVEGGNLVAAGSGAGGAAVAASDILYVPAETAVERVDERIEVHVLATQAAMADAIPGLARIVLPFGVGMIALLTILGVWLTRSISAPLGRLNRTAEALVAGEEVTFTAERDDELGTLAEVLERLRIDAAQRYDTARLEGKHAATFNKLAELTAFAADEPELVTAASRAIRRLVPAKRGDVLLANPSQNRLTVGAAWGDDARETGAVVALDRIDRCPGIRRSSAFVMDDVADDMAVRCPAQTATAGTVACVPMLALGKVVGVIHLQSDQVAAFSPEAMRLIGRVAENVGLAMANARMMKTMEGQAMSDSLTGLRNARFFDPYLEQELEAARRDQQPLSLIMVDIDHFKTFNDTHGHPAGDEALRTFARVVGGSIRASDVAARYGGEEFVIALRHAGIEEARHLAEKLRMAVEQMIVELGPGRYARITASFGVASTEMHIQDQKALVSMADAALYRAKEAGRNRVELAPTAADVVILDEASRRRLGKHGPVAVPSPQAAPG